MIVSGVVVPMVMVSALVAVPPTESVTCAVNWNDPWVVGVPSITPLAACKSDLGAGFR